MTLREKKKIEKNKKEAFVIKSKQFRRQTMH